MRGAARGRGRGVVATDPLLAFSDLRAFVVTRGEVGQDAPGELLRDPSGALHARLGADRPSLFLVRPDGHLGLRATPPSLAAVQGYLARILVA